MQNLAKRDDGPDIAALIARQRRGWSLDQAFYCDPAIFRRDMIRLIGRLWLLVDLTLQERRRTLKGLRFSFAGRLDLWGSRH